MVFTYVITWQKSRAEIKLKIFLIENPYVLIHLQSLDFDKFLEPVNDEELLVLGVPGDVTGVQPAVDDGLLGGLLVAVVALHHLRTGNTQLSILNINNS